MSRGRYIEQLKEPMLSRDLNVYFKPSVAYVEMEDPQNRAYAKGSFVFKFDKLNQYPQKRDSYVPFNGLFKNVVEFIEPNGIRKSYCEIEYSDFLEKKVNAVKKNIAGLTAAELIESTRKAGIIDEYDGIPLYEKFMNFSESEPPDVIIVNACDDEPMCSCGLNLLLKKPRRVVAGLKILERVFFAGNVFAAVYGHLGEVETGIPKSIEGLPIKGIYGTYPARQRLCEIFRCNKEKTLVVGAAALTYLYKAVVYDEPQTTCIVTVCGDCIENPSNIMVPIGTPVRNALIYCGVVKTPSRIILGNVMNGMAVTDLETPIKPDTRCIVAFSKPSEKLKFRCIGCARCVSHCPQKLTPIHIYKAVKFDVKSDLELFTPEKCISCGVCSYVCPSGLELSNAVKTANKILQKGK